MLGSARVLLCFSTVSVLLPLRGLWWKGASSNSLEVEGSVSKWHAKLCHGHAKCPPQVCPSMSKCDEAVR